MRLLTVFVLLLTTVNLVLSLINPTQRDHKERDNGKQTTNTKKREPEAPPSGQRTADDGDKNTVRTADQTQDKKVQPVHLVPDSEVNVKPIKDLIDVWVFVCTVILTLVGITGTSVALWTLFAIRDQVKVMNEHRVSFHQLATAAQDNAAAAKANTDTLKNGDRAWLLIDMVETKLAFLEAQWLIGKPEPVHFTFRVKNYGKTPARIYSIMTRYDLDVSRDSPPRTDIYQSYTPDAYPQVIPPDGKFIGRQNLNNSWLTGQQFKDVNNRAEFLWAYGVIYYRDVYGRDFYTRFCYRYEVPPVVPEGNECFCLAGNSQWNTAT